MRDMHWTVHSRNPALFVQHAGTDDHDDADGYLDSNGHGDSDSDCHAHTHGNRNGNGNRNAYTYADVYAHANCDADAHAHTHAVAHADADPATPPNVDADAGLCPAHGDAGPGIARAVGPGHARRERHTGRQRDV
jgi:hypothetical protein